MSNKVVFWTGILGVTFFGVASILGGFQFDSYNPISQYVSETMAIDTPYGKILRFFGYLPAGVLITIFSFSAIKKFPQFVLIKIGFSGLGIFYGIATIIVGLFPCDKGCNMEFPSVSQLIHTLTGLLTYIFVPISIVTIGIGLRQSKKHNALSKIAISCGLVSAVFVGILLSNRSTNFAGLYQRIIEVTFIIWVVACSIFIKKAAQLESDTNLNAQ